MSEGLTHKIVQTLRVYVSTGVCDDAELRPAVEIAVAHNAILAGASMIHDRLTTAGTYTEDEYRAVIAAVTSENKTLKADLAHQRSIVERIAEQKFGSSDSGPGIPVDETQARLDLALHTLSHLLTIISPVFSGRGLIELDARELRDAFAAGGAVLNDTCDRTSMAVVANLSFRSARLAMTALDSAKRLLPEVQPEVSAELDDRTVFSLASNAAQAAYTAAVSAADAFGAAMTADPVETAINSHQLFAGTPTKGTA